MKTRNSAIGESWEAFRARVFTAQEIHECDERVVRIVAGMKTKEGAERDRRTSTRQTMEADHKAAV